MDLGQATFMRRLDIDCWVELQPETVHAALVIAVRTGGACADNITTVTFRKSMVVEAGRG